MRRFQPIGFILIVFACCMTLCAACAPPKLFQAGTFGQDPGDELFAKAEEAFARNAYDEAGPLYEAYLVKFPQGVHGPSVMLRQAALLSARNEFERSRAAYEALMSRYPESPLAEDARIGILSSWYDQKAYQTVIDQAEKIKDQDLSGPGIVQKYSLMGDALLALGKPMDAAYVMISALKKVGESDRKKLLVTFDQVVADIDPEGLQTLLSGVRDADYRGYLACQLGQKYMINEEYDQADAVLSDCIKKFPGTSYARQAEKLMQQIKKDSVYERYTIGCLLPLTGKYRPFGERALRGVEFAFQSYTAAHENGKGLPIKLLVRDTGSDPQKAVAAVKELADSRVAAIIGPLVASEDAIAEAQNRHIPVIALAQEPNIPAMGDYVFRNFLTPRMQAGALVSYAREGLGFGRFAVLYPDEEYGRVFAHAFWDEVLAHGGQVVGFEAYDPKATDFADPIKKLVGLYYDVPRDLRDKVDAQQALWRQAPRKTFEADDREKATIVDFDAIFIPDGPSNAGLIIPQLLYYNVANVLFMGTNLWFSKELVNSANQYTDGAIMPAGFWEKSESETVRRFSEGFENLYGEKPDFFAAVAYDTANILFSILGDSELRYRSSIKRKLVEPVAFHGVTGTTTFDKTGEAHKALPLLKIQDLDFIEITPTSSLQGIQ